MAISIWQVGITMTEHSCKKERIKIINKVTKEILAIFRKADLTPLEMIGVLTVIAMSTHTSVTEIRIIPGTKEDPFKQDPAIG